MNKYKRITVIVSFSFCFVLIIAILPIIRMTANNKDEINIDIDEKNRDIAVRKSDEVHSNTTQCFMNPLYLRPILNDTYRFTHSSIILQSYEIVGCEEADKIQILLQPDQGIELISENAFMVEQGTSRQITVQYRLKEGYNNGKILINTEACENDEVIEDGLPTGIYCVNVGAHDYMSLNNMEDAMQLAGLIQYGSELPNVITDIPFTRVETGISTMSNNTTTISGTILWTDAEGTTHAAENIRVEIYYNYNGSWYLADATTTNTSGYYTKVLSTPSGYTVSVCIEACLTGRNINVKTAGGILYEVPSAVKAGVATGSNVSMSYTFDNSTNAGRAASIYQAMQYANIAVRYMEGSFLDTIDVQFPDNTEGVSCYTGNMIRIIDDDGFDWDVAQHEFGHYVSDYYNFSNSPGGDHYLRKNNADERNNKDEGIRIAWSEGWATYFAIRLQEELGLDALDIPCVGDIYLHDKDKDGLVSVFSPVHIENVAPTYRWGEAGDISVTGILYDLTDPVSSSDHDFISLGSSSLWNIITDNECTTLSDLMTAIYDSNYSTQTKLNTGTSLTYFLVSASLSNSPYDLDASTPTFTWEPQGGSNKYGNDVFNLAFYDSNYNLILRTAHTEYYYQTITPVQWNTIKNATGDYFYCCVETRQTDVPGTGPYYSNCIKVIKP